MLLNAGGTAGISDVRIVVSRPGNLVLPVGKVGFRDFLHFGHVKMCFVCNVDLGHEMHFYIKKTRGMEGCLWNL